MARLRSLLELEASRSLKRVLVTLDADLIFVCSLLRRPALRLQRRAHAEILDLVVLAGEDTYVDPSAARAAAAPPHCRRASAYIGAHQQLIVAQCVVPEQGRVTPQRAISFREAKAIAGAVLEDKHMFSRRPPAAAVEAKNHSGSRAGGQAYVFAAPSCSRHLGAGQKEGGRRGLPR